MSRAIDGLSAGANFGPQLNQFGFNISGNTNLTLVVEACTNLSKPDWIPISTNVLANGASSFRDPQSLNYPTRIYRFRMP